ncbi:MAG: hypothetical protein AB1641_09645 [Thermodesulfobacteriota bacterium]
MARWKKTNDPPATAFHDFRAGADEAESTWAESGSKPPFYLFDARDYELVSMVNAVLEKKKARKYLKSLNSPYLHPNGIKELAAAREMRIAYAVFNLLDTLAAGEAEERLAALRTVRDEVLTCATTSLRNNTGRVLLQTMKELVRAHGDSIRQLELARDFRQAIAGKPRIIRRQLRRHYLFEMPEDWNQLAFDDHVHDANTKGRKSPTHLIMDAWIKGIRSLTVIHYNHVRPEAAAELLEAAEIMGLKVRIGVEFPTCFRGRYIYLIWTPRGFDRAQEFLDLLSQPEVKQIMDEGRRVSEFTQGQVLKILAEFNEQQWPGINDCFSLNLPPLDPDDFLSFVQPGQASILHLAMYIQTRLLNAFRARIKTLRDEYLQAAAEEKKRILDLVREMDRIDPQVIIEEYLEPLAEKKAVPPLEDQPAWLKLSPGEIIDRLTQVHASSYLTLNISALAVEDLLELLHEGQGAITHLELFNLKDFYQGRVSHLAEINTLVDALNQGNVLTLKRLIRNTIHQLRDQGSGAAGERLNALHDILRDLGRFKDLYRKRPLEVRLGSDSTGRSSFLPGMGLAVLETLPPRAQREAARSEQTHRLQLPVSLQVHYRRTLVEFRSATAWLDAFLDHARRWPLLRFLGYRRLEDWTTEKASISIERQGNIISLSGPVGRGSNELRSEIDRPPGKKIGLSWTYLNSDLRDVLKILFGFIPAFLTFWLTRDWWVLAYFGAVIWFVITALRNIIQSVLGGGGLKRSPLLHWRDFVNWDRLSDSLLFTGFSVPLLDYLVKTLILDNGLGINTSTNPQALYTVIALANGVYISGHNALRGLPGTVVYGNFFRTAVSIPLAILVNSLFGLILSAASIPQVNQVLQNWAAIISKFASDCVAGIIEGTGDRYQNMARRAWDYDKKIGMIFDAFTELEMMFPENDVLEMLDSPKAFLQAISSRQENLDKALASNALDLLYFWMYQPRARVRLKSIIKKMPPLERQVFLKSQVVLKRQKEVSQMLVNGLVGKKFSRALSFYLDRWEDYLGGLERLIRRYPWPNGAGRA